MNTHCNYSLNLLHNTTKFVIRTPLTCSLPRGIKITFGFEGNSTEYARELSEEVKSAVFGKLRNKPYDDGNVENLLARVAFLNTLR